MNGLKDRLLRLIRAQGPLPIAHYMQIALGDPERGYYMRRDPLGRDFITAPEVSQIFGELIGLFFLQAWEDRGLPETFHLVELGPGRGTLMADLLRAAKIRPAFIAAARITLIESSPVLRARQAEALADFDIAWALSLGGVANDGPLFLVANEFFDALPIRQFIRMGGGWHERMIGADGDKLVFLAAPDPVPGSVISAPLREAPEGAVFEISPAAQAIAQDIGHRIARHGGVALIADYGHAASALGDTLQALKAHRYADPLDEPGEADLTAHVDFASLAGAAREAGADVRGPTTQAAFLEALGIRGRAERLKTAAPEESPAIDAAIDRLLGEGQMGTLFKILAIAEGGAPGLPGFPC